MIITQNQTSEPDPSKTGIAANEKTVLPVRWVVLFTGSVATDDYHPFASHGEPEALIKEISELCLAFHPGSQMAQFPKESAAYLFWRTRSTGDWVITRVGVAPNPVGLRTALEYCSLVFSDEMFRLLRYNPFRTRSLNLHDRVQKHFLARNTEPFRYTMLGNTAPAGEGNAPCSRRDAAAAVAASTAAENRSVVFDILRMIPGVSEDQVANEDNVRAIQEYCSRWHDVPQPPPTFTTWWPSHGPEPADYFDVVLRPVALKALTLREATKAVSLLVVDVKLTLPSPPSYDIEAVEAVRAILDAAAAAERSVMDAARRAHNETPGELKALLMQTAHYMTDLSAHLDTLARRFANRISSEDATPITDLIDRALALQQDVQVICSPNPFQVVGSRLEKSGDSTSVAPPPATKAGSDTPPSWQNLLRRLRNPARS